MNIERKDIDAVNMILSIQISEADYAEPVEKSLKEYRRKANIPGFRPGMVPMGLLRKMYGKAVLVEEVNRLVGDGLSKYITDNNLNVLGEPMSNETEQKNINFDTDKTFEFKFDVAVAPEFVLNLTSKDKLTYYNIIVSDEEVDKHIKTYTSRFGSYSQVDTVVDERDMIKGNVQEMDGKKLNEQGLKVQDVVLMPAYVKNTVQKNKLKKAKKGESLVFNPAKAFENETELSSFLKVSKEEAGLFTSDFTLEVTEITHYAESPIDQSLFDKVYGAGNVKSEAEFRAKVAEEVKASYVNDSDYKFSVDAQAALVQKLDKIEFPNDFLKRWLLHNNKKMTQETLDRDYGQMLEGLKWQLIKDKIAKENPDACKIEQEDLRAFGRKAARLQFAQYGMMTIPDNVIEEYTDNMMKKEESVRNMYERVLEEKVLEVVKTKVHVEQKDIDIAAFNKMFEEKIRDENQPAKKAAKPAKTEEK